MEATQSVLKNHATRPKDCAWREVSQGRDVPSEWVAREPLFRQHWETTSFASSRAPWADCSFGSRHRAIGRGAITSSDIMSLPH